MIFKNVAVHQSGEAFKATSKLFEVHHSAVRKVIHKCKTLKSCHNHSGVDIRAMLRETAENTRPTSQSLNFKTAQLEKD